MACSLGPTAHGMTPSGNEAAVTQPQAWQRSRYRTYSVTIAAAEGISTTWWRMGAGCFVASGRSGAAQFRQLDG